MWRWLKNLAGPPSAIRDMLARCGRTVVPRSPYTSRDQWSDERRWDERDPWEDDRPGYREKYDYDEPDEAPRDAKPVGVPPAVAVGLGLWRWWLCRSGNWRAALTLGLGAGVTAFLGGPTIRVILATLAAAAELLSPAGCSTRATRR